MDVDFNQIIRPNFVFLVLLLNIIGSVLKHRTDLDNKLIPLVLFGVSFFSLSLWGWFSSEMIGSARIVDTFFTSGLVHGVVITAIATYGWDVVHGSWKHGLFRKKELKDGGVR